MIIKKGKKIIAKDAILLTDFFKQMVGLRFKKKKNIIFDFKQEKKEIIDMLFVFFPIDLVFLDKNKKITELKQKLTPFTFYKAKNKARYLLELDAFSIAKNRLKLGDKIDF